MLVPHQISSPRTKIRPVVGLNLSLAEQVPNGAFGRRPVHGCACLRAIVLRFSR